MKTYGKADVETIIGQHLTHLYEIRDDGVWPMKADGEWILPWSPAVDLDGADAPNPLEAPNLPIPFTANQLAAFMLDGVGAGVASVYGTWEKGPVQDMLAPLDPRARGAREALVAAYAAYRAADAVVGPLNHKSLEGLSTAEYEAAYLPWRKAMVWHLLTPQEPSDKTSVKPVQRSAAQDAEILNVLKRLGHNPQALPVTKMGLPSVKADVRAELKDHRLFVGATIFNKAWDRLRKSGDIVNV